LPSAHLPNRFVVPVVVPPGTSHTYWVRTFNYIYAPTPIVSQLFTPKASFSVMMREETYIPAYFMVLSLLTGALFFMCLYALYYYWLVRDKAFLYYGLYVSTGFVQAFYGLDTRFHVGLVYQYLPILGIPYSITLSIGLYMLFIMQLLKAELQHPVVKKVLWLMLMILAIQQTGHFIEYFWQRPLFETSTYYIYMLIPTGLFALLMIGLIARSKNPVKNYLLAGSLSIFVFVLFPLFTNLYFPKVPPALDVFINSVSFWAYLGITIECFCFAMALAYRSRLVEVEKNQLQQNYTRQLETELATRMKEIATKNQELENQRIRHLETAFEQKLAETEMTALRSQMNPHFIFQLPQFH
jgi:hypothetical protein